MKLLGRGHDPSFGAEVREKDIFKRYRDELHEYWSSKLENQELKALTYSKWKLFWETGDRERYETDYFERRYALEHATILALIYPEEQKYIDKLMDVICAVCDEYTWCLTAYQAQNETNDNARIDLFEAETGTAGDGRFCYFMDFKFNKGVRDFWIGMR